MKALSRAGDAGAEAVVVGCEVGSDGYKGRYEQYDTSERAGSIAYHMRGCLRPNGIESMQRAGGVGQR